MPALWQAAETKKMDNNVIADRVERLAGRKPECFEQGFLPGPEFDLLETEFWLAEGTQCETPDTAGSAASLMATDREGIQPEFGFLF